VFNMGATPLAWTPPEGDWSILESAGDVALDALPPFSGYLAVAG
jgi:hypothetical protein